MFCEISIEQYNESARTGILSANTIVNNLQVTSNQFLQSLIGLRL